MRAGGAFPTMGVGGVFPPTRMPVCSLRLENSAAGGEAPSDPRASNQTCVGARVLPTRNPSFYIL